MKAKKKFLACTLNPLRYFIGSILFATALGKLLDIPGFAEVIDSYQVVSGWITIPLGLGLAVTELGLAIWLFSGKNLGSAALGSAFLHGGFMIWLLIAIFRGLKLTNCGCFGVFLPRPLGWITVFEDLLMVILSLLLYYKAKSHRGE